MGSVICTSWNCNFSPNLHPVHSSMSYRRRSQSASTSSSFSRRSPSTLCNSAIGKRSYFSSTHSNFSCSSKWDVDAWRSKRRRREVSPYGSAASSDDDFPSNKQSPADRSILSANTFSRPSFPSSSADFFPRNDNARHRHSAHIPGTFDFSSHHPYSQEELVELKSNAFWDLQRSIAENGESLIRRMRDYEISRSRAETFTKVKDAQKRGRKRSSLIASPVRKEPVYQDSDAEDGDEEDDEVQILSGDIPDVLLSSKSARPSGGIPMEDDGASQHSMSTRGRSLSDTRRSSSPCSSSMSDDDDYTMDSHPSSDAPSIDLDTPTPTSSANSSMSSLPLPSENYSSPFFTVPPPTASRSEKALAALSLAMANGAGSINDYAGLDFPSLSSNNTWMTP
ncbi:hypothetical protein K435DRAFT_224612 [Dendrothele bispora CBS 962.96]|uniref:Uncharacterized protein n=1 Tax=Dendrothele bispora (strain CBS 962.96) TaxID=1314807 RepID=A0A4S8LQV6_DENBC|nr:hypothetical protein K435DRAFT_224612 [Dendrothele bispora CBS 962.96]